MIKVCPRSSRKWLQAWPSPHSQGNPQSNFWILCPSNRDSPPQQLPRVFLLWGLQTQSRLFPPLTLRSALGLWDPAVSLQNSIHWLGPARLDVHGITTWNQSIDSLRVDYSEENSWFHSSGSRTKKIIQSNILLFSTEPRSSASSINVKVSFQRKSGY